MLRRPATARTVHTGVSQYLAQRVTTDVYALSLPQQLAQVRVVDSRVSGPRQDHHVGRQRVRCSVGRSAISIAVSECGCAVPSVDCQDAPGVARAHSHQSRCLLRGHMVRHQTVENLKPCLLSLRQCHMFLHADIFADQLAGDIIVDQQHPLHSRQMDQALAYSSRIYERPEGGTSECSPIRIRSMVEREPSADLSGL